MGWRSLASSAWVAGQAAAAVAAERFERLLSLLRTIQVLLLMALFTLLGTVLVSMARPAWTPYAYSLGAIVLSVPLVAVLVLVWRPLHSRPVRRAERWARIAPRAQRERTRANVLQRELEAAHREIRRLRRTRSKAEAQQH